MQASASPSRPLTSAAAPAAAAASAAAAAAAVPCFGTGDACYATFCAINSKSVLEG